MVQINKQHITLGGGRLVGTLSVDGGACRGEALVDNPGRFGTVETLGLDETLMVRVGPYRRQEFSTQIVDVGARQLLDVVPGRSGAEPMAWLAARDVA